MRCGLLYDDNLGPPENRKRETLKAPKAPKAAGRGQQALGSSSASESGTGGWGGRAVEFVPQFRPLSPHLCRRELG